MITFLLVLLGVGIVLCLSAAVLTAWSLLHPPRMTDGKALWLLHRLSPQDLGMAFEDVNFQTGDEHGRPLKIAAWWIPADHSQGRCAIIVHGYADAKVGAIAWAPLWRSLGFDLLVPDLRAHGESGGSLCTAGYFERNDLTQVINELRARWPVQTRQLILFGISMGAGIAAATANDRRDIDAVILDSPYADFRTAAMEHMSRLGLPGKQLPALALRIAQWLSGANFDDVATDKLIERLSCPILLIDSGNDWFLNAAARQNLREAVERHARMDGASEFWTVEGVEHLMAIVADPQHYRDRLARFLSSLPTDRRLEESNEPRRHKDTKNP